MVAGANDGAEPMAKKRARPDQAAAADNAELSAKKRGRSDEAAAADNAEQVAQPKRMRWADGAALKPSHLSKVSTSCMVACLQTLFLLVHIGEYGLHDVLSAEATAACQETTLMSGSNLSFVHT